MNMSQPFLKLETHGQLIDWISKTVWLALSTPNSFSGLFNANTMVG